MDRLTSLKDLVKAMNEIFKSAPEVATAVILETIPGGVRVMFKWGDKNNNYTKGIDIKTVVDPTLIKWALKMYDIACTLKREKKPKK